MEIKNVLEEGSEQRILMQSHFEGETWGLTIFDNKFITSGDDNQILYFDADTHQCIQSGKVSEKIPKAGKTKPTSSTSSD